MEENKVWRKEKNGDLHCTVLGDANLTIPHEGKNIQIGVYHQTTEQTIKKDKARTLVMFIENQKKSAEAQIEKMKEELEKLKHVESDMVPDQVIKNFNEAYKKGTKAFKKEVAPMQNILTAIVRKRQLTDQMAFLEKQLKVINKDLANIGKCLK